MSYCQRIKFKHRFKIKLFLLRNTTQSKNSCFSGKDNYFTKENNEKHDPKQGDALVPSIGKIVQASNLDLKFAMQGGQKRKISHHSQNSRHSCNSKVTFSYLYHVFRVLEWACSNVLRCQVQVFKEL